MSPVAGTKRQTIGVAVADRMENQMTYEDRNLFRMGQRVNDTLLSARVGTLRPSRLEMKTAAASLNIQQSLAWKAWNTYTWMVD